MADQYFVRIRGRVGGPFDEDKLKLLTQRGQLGRMHELSKDGVDWITAGQLEHLFPKRSSKNTTDEKQPVNDNQTSGPQAASHPGTRGEEPPEWYFSSGGTRRGPLPLSELVSSAESGEIQPSTLVWKEGMPNWIRACEVKQLTATLDPGTTQIPWAELLPLSRIVNDGSWGLAWVQCLAVAVLFPLFVLEYHGEGHVDLTWAATAFTLYFTLIWSAFFHWCIDPRSVGYWRLAGVWLTTATLGILLVFVFSSLLLPFFGDAIAADTEASLLKQVVGWTVGVGLVEEGGKLLVILAFTSAISAENAGRTCAYIGIVSGLAFGTVEALGYTHRYVEMHSAATGSGQDAYGALFILLMTRWISLPLLHAIWAGITGYFVGLSHNATQGRWRWVAFGLCVSALLHGCYDVGAGKPELSWISMLIAAVSIALLVGYLRSEVSLTRKVAAFVPRGTNTD